MFRIIKDFIDKRKFEKQLTTNHIVSDEVKPVYCPSKMSYFIQGLVAQYMDYRDIWLQLKENSTPILHLEQYRGTYKIVVNTSLGIRRLLFSVEGDWTFLNYADNEKTLYQFREYRLSKDEPYKIELTYIDNDCHWTAESIINSVEEVVDILQDIITSTIDRNVKLAQDLAKY